ncbi:MAG: GTPase Era [Candidatus Sumerlaeaceae bacterium]|nr:GTPase Era [Candidatus Sumerlaeaceae bacterium]
MDQPTAAPFRSGYVAILGKPNAGKSTLMNAIVGEKIAIVSDKPQTTRDRIAGIFTTTEFQIVFLDTPGIIVPQDRLNESLMARAAEALEGIDVLYHLADATDREPPNERLLELLRRAKPRARFLVINKIDRARGDREPIPPGIDPTRYDEVFFVSALKRQGLDKLIERTTALLQPGPMYYDPEQLSDRDERFLAAEIVREKVFRHTGAEIPYAVYTEVAAFEERPGKDFISVAIYVERDSQKGIIIGDGGRTLKTIGSEARRGIEKLTGRPAYLELRVKLRKNWRKKENELANFGFKPPPKKGRKKS